MPDEVARLVAVMEANLKGFTKGMDQAQKIADQRFGQIERRMKQTENVFSKSFSTLGASGLTRFLSAAALLSFGKAVLTTTAAISEQAQQVGVGVEAFQAYVGILKDAGASSEQAQLSIAHLTEKLGEAKTGSKAAREAFQAFGIDVNDLVKMKPEEAFQAVAVGAAKFSDEAKRAAALSQVFGERVSRFLVPALGDLAKGADENIRAQKELGRVIDEALAKRADEALDKLNQRWDELIKKATPAVLAVVDLLNGMATAAQKTADVIGDIFESRAKGQTKPGFFQNLTPEEMQRRFNPLGGGGIGGAVPGRMGPAQAPEEPPASVNITPAQTNDFIESLPHIIQFAEDAQNAIDEADQRIAESMQETTDKIGELWDDLGQREAESQQETSDQINQLWDDYYQSQAEAQQEFIDEVQAKWDDYYQRQAEDSERAHEKFVDELSDGIASLGVAALEGGESFKRAIDGMIRQIEFLIIKLLVVKALESAFGKDSVVSGLIGTLGFASGGRPPVGRASIVGERGPELFVPDTAGTVIPNYKAAAMAGGGRSIAISVTNQMSFAGAVDAASIRQMINQGDASTASGVIKYIERAFPGYMVKAQKSHF